MGTSSLNKLVRIPKAEPDNYHRRVQAWRPDSFWEHAMHTFRIEAKPGPLI